MIVNTSGLTEPAVLWLTSGELDEFGREKLSPPSEILSRWEMDPNLISDALVELKDASGIIYLSAAASVGSFLWRGALADLDATPVNVSGLFKIVKYREVPDVKGRSVRLSAIVSETKEALPDVYQPNP